MHVLGLCGSLFLYSLILAVRLCPASGTPGAALLLAEKHNGAVIANGTVTHIDSGADNLNIQVHGRFCLMLPSAP